MNNVKNYNFNLLLTSSEYANHVTFWKEQLRKIDGNCHFRSYKKKTSQKEGDPVAHEFALGKNVEDIIRRISKNSELGSFVVLLSGLYLLFYKYNRDASVIYLDTPLLSEKEEEGFNERIPLVAEVSGDGTIRDFVKQLQDIVGRSYNYQSFPIGDLAISLQTRGLTNVLVRQEGLHRHLQVPSAYPVEILVKNDDSFRIEIKSHTGLFEEEDLYLMEDHLNRVLGHYQDLNTLVSSLDLLNDAEEEYYKNIHLQNHKPVPSGDTISSLFEKQVETTAENTAVVSQDKVLNYISLNKLSNRLAHSLIEDYGIRPGDVVGVMTDRSDNLIISILAVMKAGATYLPLDADYPDERIEYMIRDAGVKLLLVHSVSFPKLISFYDIPTFAIDFQLASLSNSEENIAPAVSAADPAYIIYTSGSTGKPKGVVLSHRGFVNMIIDQIDGFGLTPEDKVIQFASPSFDASLSEIFMALLSGAAVVMVSKDIINDAPLFLNFIKQKEVSVATFPPSYLASIERGKLPTLKTIITAGEAAKVEDAIFYAREKKYFNAYGPTETSVCATYYKVDPEKNYESRIPIGKPIRNSAVYVLDDHLQPVPQGMTGELCISGAGLAIGYLNKEEITLEKFVPHPFAEGQLMYRTGDLGFFLPDRSLEMTGRRDDQVKIRGYRIELGEVESVLIQHAEVKEAAVVSQLHLGDLRMVAYFIAEGGQIVDLSGLREYLKGKLPEYMVPSVFVPLDSFPLTPNGKVDRKRLPAPEALSLKNEFIAPSTPSEQIIASIWKDILGIPEVGVTDNFFELGGHSLLATQILSRVRDSFGVEVSLKALFEDPTIAGIDRYLKSASGNSSPVSSIHPVPENTSLPLSFAQQRLWFLDQLEGAGPAYNIVVALKIEGALDIKFLRQSINEIIKRHSSLRTVFDTLDGQPVQRILPGLEIEVAVEHFQTLPSEEKTFVVPQRIKEIASQVFDIKTGPLLNVHLLKTGPAESILVVSMHHIISDGWSLGVFVKEFSRYYSELQEGNLLKVEPLPVQYKDFAVWQRNWLQGDVLKVHVEYWKKQLSGVPELLHLPTDRPRPAIQTFHGAVERFEISSELSQQIKAFSNRSDVTVFMTLITGFMALLARYSRQYDIAVGTPIANRNHREIEPLIGFFVNTLVIRAGLSDNPTMEELLKRVRETTLAAYLHQDLPFEKLVEELQPKRNLSHSPLFQVMFTLHNTPVEQLQLPGIKVAPLHIEGNNAKFDLTLSMEEKEGQFKGLFQYNTDLFDRATIQRMTGHFLALLEDMIFHPEQKVSQLAILTSAEKEQLLVKWNDTKAFYPADQCIHQLIEAQTEKRSGEIAVVFEGKQVTYAELNARANHLAAYLRKRKVEPGQMVGIYCRRSVEMMVSILGILKAGAAYVPLDPSYPKDRIGYIMEDAGLQIILTQEALSSQLNGFHCELLCVDQEWMKLSEESAENIASLSSPEDLAYVIYTSGSTGKPKGVLVEHRNVVNFFTGMDARIGVEPGTWMAVTTISFDISVLELLWTLSRGFKVVIQNDEMETFAASSGTSTLNKEMDFSLFYFSSADDDNSREGESKYELLLEGAKFADAHGFAAVWTPERHFHHFGGLYPNPSVTSAAIAAVTKNISIRAGSVVAPLHHPLRIAEEWSVVDNISKGRVGISYASGWQANDFVLSPMSYDSRHQLMYEQIETVRRLWKGEKVAFKNPKGKEVETGIYPKPVQKDIPVWVTAAGSPETFRSAGKIGANLLTHMLSQNIEDLTEKIGIYRKSWEENGHEGKGIVTVMLHTYVGKDLEEVRQTARQPFYNYLKSSLDLIRNFAQAIGKDIDSSDFTEQDMEALLEHAYGRYFNNSSLMGTPDSCMKMVERLGKAGVDEIGCLIDFGIDQVKVFESLKHLHKLKELQKKKATGSRKDYSLPAQIREHKATYLQCTPSLAKVLLLDEETVRSLSSVRKLMLGGEKLPYALVKELHEKLPAEIHNMYGPTETTIWSSTACIERGADRVTIGKPISNTFIYILDENFQPSPIGLAGELYIGGDGVVRGYLNREELTRERFVPDPFSDKPGARMYRTGDMARYLADGTIEFVGRNDNQAKVRGYRIELGEIESVLASFDGVREPVVVVREDASGNAHLVCYLTLREDQPADVPAIRQYLKAKLPEYMVPSSFVILEEMPLTPNGKIDRNALPDHGNIQKEDREYVAPRNPVEELLANIWKDVLGVDKVGVYDNFFDIGGHSLLATLAISRIRNSFSVEIPVRMIFSSPVIAELARYIEESKSGASQHEGAAIVPADRNALIPLSFAQQRLWFLYQLEGKTSTYNMSSALWIEGKLNTALFKESVNNLVQRHESLRTTFEMADAIPAQVIHPSLVIDIPEYDLENAGEEKLKTILREKAQEPFDLTTGPLLRIHLYKTGNAKHIMQIMMHHIISDGWSVALFIRELSQMYKQASDGVAVSLPGLTVQYADFAVWQRNWLSGSELEKQLGYWKKQLAGAPSLLKLPADRPRPAIQTFRGRTEKFAFGKEFTDRLNAFSKEHNATLYMVLMTGFVTLLSRYSNQEDIVVGSPIANRNRKETESLIGFFVNTLMLRTDLSGNPDFRTLLGRVKEALLGAYAHQDLPFEKLVEELDPDRNLSHSPLFQVMFVLQNAPMESLELPGITIKPVAVESVTSKYDITLSMEETGSGLQGFFEYNSDLFHPSTIQRMTAHFKQLLEGMIMHQEENVFALPILTETDIRVIHSIRKTDAAIPAIPMHVLFEKQAAANPGGPALIVNGKSVNYRELNEAANQLAVHLEKMGLEKEEMIGVFAERSEWTIIALLGILKAGGVYVPLDTDYPQARLRYMISDSGMRKLITPKRHLDLIQSVEMEMCCIDEEWEEIQKNKNVNPGKEIAADHLGYMIYTSGSTGQPKGVMLEHKGLNNLLSNQIRAFDLDAECRILQFASLSFDASIWEILSALGSGAALVLESNDRLVPGESLLNTLEERAVTHVTLPPSALALLPEAPLEKLRNLVVAGESCPAALIKKWAPARKFFNAYGPTESTICATWQQCSAETGGSVIGTPVTNTSIFIVNRQMQEVPVGVPGEICIGGIGLARGYRNREELTAEKFVTFRSEDKEHRIYRTGDLGRVLPDGTLEFSGRIDEQVKVRGYRVEPAEIEQALMQHRDISFAVVLLHGQDESDRKLVAYLRKERTEISSEELRDYLSERLPVYMVPSYFIFIDSVPLTPNGKIDKKALTEMSFDRTALKREYLAPRNSAELKMVRIWENVLNVHPVGIRDNFFELGGHSLLAAKLISVIQKEFEITVPLANLFLYPSVEKLMLSLTDASQEETTCLIPLQTEGTQPPLFIVPGAAGNAVSLLHLSQRLGKDRPVYGLQSPGLDDRSAPLNGIENIGSVYMKAIRKVQPNGPYYLAGHSIGGVIALEISQQLIGQGQEVAYLAILDKEAPVTDKIKPVKEVSNDELIRQIGIAAEYFTEGKNSLSGKTKKRAKENEILTLQRILEEHHLLPANSSLDQAEGLLNVVRANYSIAYRRKHTVPVKIALFIASDKPENNKTMASDDFLGWSDFSSGKPEVYHVPGNHYSMLNGPHASSLAEKLKESLDQVPASETADAK